MATMIERGIIFIPLLFIMGCQKNYVVKEYMPPESSQAASIHATTDPYRNSDHIYISLVSRDSCADQYNLMQISHLQAKPFWEEDIREADFYLPVSKVINLRITNSSDSGFVIMSCSNIKSYNLKENEKYVMKIKNWSSVDDPGVFESSFGCKFDLINSSGNIEDEVTTDLPQCED